MATLARPLLYLDVDGVLLGKTDHGIPAVGPAEHADEFLRFCVEHFNCYWLTTHCREGSADRVVRLLEQYFRGPTMTLIKGIRPTRWTTLKTEAIDLGSDFYWVDDGLLRSEQAVLRAAGVFDRWIRVDTRRNPVDLDRALDVLRSISPGEAQPSRAASRRTRPGGASRRTTPDGTLRPRGPGSTSRQTRPVAAGELGRAVLRVLLRLCREVSEIRVDLADLLCTLSTRLLLLIPIALALVGTLALLRGKIPSPPWGWSGRTGNHGPWHSPLSGARDLALMLDVAIFFLPGGAALAGFGSLVLGPSSRAGILALVGFAALCVLASSLGWITD